MLCDNHEQKNRNLRLDLERKLVHQFLQKFEAAKQNPSELHNQQLISN